MNVSKTLALIEEYNSIIKGHEDKTVQRLNAALVRAFNYLEVELIKKYNKLKKNGSITSRQRAILLLAEIKELLKIGGLSSAFVQTEFNLLLTFSSEAGINLADLLMTARKNDFLVQTTVMPLEAVAIAAEEQTRRLQKYGDDFADKVTALVEQGLILGWGSAKIVSYLRSELGLAQSRADLIARTASISAFNQATQNAFERNGINFFQFVATQDDRTCPYCMARNMNVYELNVSRPPLHGRCRCYSMPWKKDWQELGLTDDEWARNYYKDGLEFLSKAGKVVNNGVAPFEKNEGLITPPIPIWSAKD